LSYLDVSYSRPDGIVSNFPYASQGDRRHQIVEKSSELAAGYRGDLFYFVIPLFLHFVIAYYSILYSMIVYNATVRYMARTLWLAALWGVTRDHEGFRRRCGMVIWERSSLSFPIKNTLRCYPRFFQHYFSLLNHRKSREKQPLLESLTLQ
jgi:hypothetical protein